MADIGNENRLVLACRHGVRLVNSCLPQGSHLRLLIKQASEKKGCSKVIIENAGFSGNGFASYI